MPSGSEDDLILAHQEADREYAQARYREWRDRNPEFAAARDVRFLAQRKRLDQVIHSIFLNSNLGAEKTREYNNLSANTYALTTRFEKYASSAEELDSYMTPLVKEAADYLQTAFNVVQSAQKRKAAVLDKGEASLLAEKEAQFRQTAGTAKQYFTATGNDKALGVLLMFVGTILAIGTLCCCRCVAKAGYRLFTGNKHAERINEFQQSVNRAVSDMAGDSIPSFRLE